MLYFKAFHIIAMVAWFAGLFYLPRLFVYHTQAEDQISISRFKIMERRLYYGITWPSGLLTTVFGVILLSYQFKYYLNAPWMHLKLSLVILVWAYHLGCGYYLKKFSKDSNHKSSTFFRLYNELPTLFLICIVLLVVIRPF
jgi:putative membrane protein